MFLSTLFSLPADVYLADVCLEQETLTLVLKTSQTTGVNAPLRPQVIVLEDLNVDGMTCNRKLARAVSDVGIAEFRAQVEYKSLWNGEMLLFADRFFPSSKKCHGCDWEWKEMELSDRIFICQNPKCRFYLVQQDRDFNASENLAELGYEYLRSLR
jgi:transposase